MSMMNTSRQEIQRVCDNKSEDSRLKFTRVTHPHFAYERTYCIVCGKPKGHVSVESSQSISPTNVILICDDCICTYGPPDLPRANIEGLVEDKAVK
jgi:hypothetical protein